MELILEIIIYLIISLGIVLICYVAFGRNSIEDINNKREYYSRNKQENESLVINIRYKNIAKEELDKIKNSIENGEYNDILDIADEINYIDSCAKKKK